MRPLNIRRHAEPLECLFRTFATCLGPSPNLWSLNINDAMFAQWSPLANRIAFWVSEWVQRRWGIVTHKSMKWFVISSSLTRLYCLCSPDVWRKKRNVWVPQGSEIQQTQRGEQRGKPPQAHSRFYNYVYVSTYMCRSTYRQLYPPLKGKSASSFCAPLADCTHGGQRHLHWNAAPEWEQGNVQEQQHAGAASKSKSCNKNKEVRQTEHSVKKKREKQKAKHIRMLAKSWHILLMTSGTKTTIEHCNSWWTRI